MSEWKDEARPLCAGERRTPLFEPQRGVQPIGCRHCLAEIEAHETVSIHGLSAGYRWRHVDTGKVRCEPNPPCAQPYDEYDAERRLTTTEENANA